MPAPSHDQNFKNLILDYPRQALAFFAPDEAHNLDGTVRITPIRQEQLKDRLGDRFHELDVPLLAEWPDGRREALLFVLEEESAPGRFSIHRLVSYCATLAELMGTNRVVPVVIFLRGGERVHRHLDLGSERHTYLRFDYLTCILSDTPADAWLDSPNLVARLNLPNMRWPRERKLEIYAQAVRGLIGLEPNIEKRIKYMDFIDIYSPLDDNERRLYEQRYPQENDEMLTWSERARHAGMEQGLLQGLEKGRLEGREDGERELLTRQLSRRFGPLDRQTSERLQTATRTELERWADNILDAQTLEDVFNEH
jgi:hypothetical protein